MISTNGFGALKIRWAKAHPGSSPGEGTTNLLHRADRVGTAQRHHPIRFAQHPRWPPRPLDQEMKVGLPTLHGKPG